MRPSRRVLVLGLTIALAPAAGVDAQDQTRLKLATELLEVMQARKVVERQTDAVMKAQVAAIAAVAQGSGVSTAEVKKLEALQGEVRDLVMNEIGWDTIVQEGAPIYASLFTEAELKAMIAFFETPAGRAWVEKSPEIAARMGDVVQQRMTTIMPKVQELIRKRLQQ